MRTPFLAIDEWIGMSDAGRSSRAIQFGTTISDKLSFQGLRQFGQRAGSFPMAVFRLEGREFVLIPGGDISLGFDLEGWAPSTQEREDLEGWTLDEILSQTIQRPRHVRIATFLVETCPWDVSWEPVDSAQPEVRAVFRRYLENNKERRAINAEGYRVMRLQPEGNEVVADRLSKLSLDDIEHKLAREGCRLLSADEWEYVCGAGGTTLFRWGDHAPDGVDRVGRYWEMQFLRRNVQLYGAERLGELDASGWGVHQRRNDFGVLIAFDAHSYRGELVKGGRLRGGDGGSFVGSGATRLLAWLPLATPFVPVEDPVVLEFGAYNHRTVARRVLSPP